jgi:serine/threonine protein kinase
MLGEFRIVREIGRGGMGVVYEAIQLPLGRRVALKVLPSAASLDPRQQKRFQVEAQAAALLHHEHIVPVFGSGFDQGLHYYAMQLIDGHSLTHLIQDLQGKPAPETSAGSTTPYGHPVQSTVCDHAVPSRSSGHSALSRARCREAAKLGLQAAEALEHAHEVGVIHRDIKPSNLLIDERGSLWVADFGLARLPESDLDLTRTGDFLGTLRYMSPEQLRAERGGVNSATDIYSLGVTLYELLTLRPAFEAQDRQELVRRILHDDPIPPRRINPAIPRDLETIILKSMEKAASARYASASDLADDLRRFLEDQPIRARRPGVFERMIKWSRRHRTIVIAGVSALVLTLATSTAILWEAKRRTDASAAELKRVNDELVEAQRVATKTISDNAAALNGQFKAMNYALGTLDQIIRPLVPSEGVNPALSEEAKRVLNLATLLYYDRIPKDVASHEGMKEQVALAYRQAGFCRLHLGTARGREDYRQSIRLYEELAAKFTDRIWLRTRLIETLHEYSRLLTAPTEKVESVKSFRRALVVAKTLIGNPEASQHCYAMALAGPFNDLAWDLVRRPPALNSDAELAVRLARQAIEWEPGRAGGTWNTLGVAYYRLGDWSSAASAIRKSMELNQGADPADRLFMAAIDHHRGKPAEARRMFDQTIAWLKQNPEKIKGREQELEAFRKEIGVLVSK